MTATLVPAQAVTDALEVHNLNEGGSAYVMCSADITVFFWDEVTKDYQVLGTDIASPGGHLDIPIYRARFTGSGTFNLRVVVAAP